jgi:hypothetical protein
MMPVPTFRNAPARYPALTTSWTVRPLAGAVTEQLAALFEADPRARARALSRPPRGRRHRAA